MSRAKYYKKVYWLTKLPHDQDLGPGFNSNDYQTFFMRPWDSNLISRLVPHDASDEA